MIYTAHFSAIHIKNRNLSQQVDIIKKFTFLKKYIPFSCSNEVKKNASTPFFSSFFFPHCLLLKKKNMDTPTDTSDCDTESGFIFPHKQRQTHPPQNNNINSRQTYPPQNNNTTSNTQNTQQNKKH